MQLDCTIHYVAGVRADSHCRKCARRNANKKVVDSENQVTPSVGVASPLPLNRSGQLISPGITQPAGSLPSLRATAPLGSAEISIARANATQLQIQLRGKKCVACGAGSIGVVFCFEACPACGERINGFISKLPWYPGPCVGELFEKTRADLRRLLRTR